MYFLLARPTLETESVGARFRDTLAPRAREANCVQSVIAMQIFHPVFNEILIQDYLLFVCLTILKEFTLLLRIEFDES